MHFARPLILLMALMAIQTSSSFGVYCHARIPENHAKALTVKDINKAILEAYKEIGGDANAMKKAMGKHYESTKLLEIDFDSLKITPTPLNYHITLCYHHQDELRYGCVANTSASDLKKTYGELTQGKNIIVNNYADNFGDYMVLTLTPSYLSKTNEEGDPEKASTILHLSILKVGLPQDFGSKPVPLKNKIQDKRERFIRSVYTKLAKSLVDLKDTIECGGR